LLCSRLPLRFLELLEPLAPRIPFPLVELVSRQRLQSSLGHDALFILGLFNYMLLYQFCTDSPPLRLGDRPALEHIKELGGILEQFLLLEQDSTHP